MPYPAPDRIALILCTALLCTPLLRARAADAEAALTPADYDDEATLARLLWDHAPDVIEARGQIGVSASQVTRSRLYPNPQLDLGWNTIPIGRTNPPDLEDPIGNVPNYTVGLSELFELAKRGPRQAAAAAELEATRAQAKAVFADRFFDLLRAIGRIATAQVRESVINQQVEQGAGLLDLERARADKGEVAQMQVDRSETEQARLIVARDAARVEVEQARAECASLLAAPCPPFPSGDAARRYLRQAATASLPGEWSPEMEARRPDLSALQSALQAADQKVTLAKRQAIPDVTLRLGYTYDTFVAAGNQRQSLGVGMQVPLPVMDHGQADLEAASAALVRAQRARTALVSSSQLLLAAALRERELIGARTTQLASAVANADRLLHALEGAARQGGMSQVDVLLARRHYQELLLEGAEVQGDAFDATLKIRQAAALFPQPPLGVEEAKR